MPFLFNEVVTHFETGHRAKKLGHAYLLTGSTPEEVESLALALASLILTAPAEGHPDFFRVQPESKSRRITVKQMRELEKNLYLKPFKAPQKVAVVLAAERMCLGQAEAANAFLKTLEEPPAATVIFLCSTAPQLFLPTILSRCIRVDLLPSGDDKITAGEEEFLKQWFAVDATKMSGAYRRVNLLQAFWQGARKEIEERLEEGDLEEEAMKALAEGEFQLVRQRTLALLQKRYWQTAGDGAKNGSFHAARHIRPIQILEELQSSLQRNVEAGLAIDHACLQLTVKTP